ncbi:MAG: dipeptidase [Planctomycetes bacterium]|nr:dipeptidase [Planctomycetota bacterium]
MPSSSEPFHYSRREALKFSVAGAGVLPLLPIHAEAAPEEPVREDPERIAAKIRDNEEMQRTREAALDLLKPKQRDLEHGLALHKQSVVFDGYAFAPRAAIDGAALANLIEEGASDNEIQDLSETMGMTRYVNIPAEREEFELAWQASGVTCVFQNAGEECQAPLRLLKRLARFTYATDMLRDFITRAVTPNDITAAKKAGKRCLYLTGNGVPLTQDWVSVQDELRYVSVFFQLGIRMMHVTYQRRNMLGDGCAETANGGLSDFGRHAIAEMNRTGVIVDVAHSGWQTSLEAAKSSTKPVVASHTAAAGLHKHIRGKPDEVLKALADSGGYAGICCIPQFLGSKGDLVAFLDHIDYVVRKVGVDHVAIGTDIAYTSRNAEKERRKMPKSARKRERFASLWPKETFVATPKARDSLAWTNWPLYTVGLVQRGYSDQDIQKIIGGNVLRVAHAVLIGR